MKHWRDRLTEDEQIIVETASYLAESGQWVPAYRLVELVVKLIQCLDEYESNVLPEGDSVSLEGNSWAVEDKHGE